MKTSNMSKKQVVNSSSFVRFRDSLNKSLPEGLAYILYGFVITMLNLVKFFYKTRRFWITLLIFAIDIAILIPAVRLGCYSIRIRLDNDLRWWDFSQQITIARSHYVQSNIIAGWLHSMGASFWTYLLRIVILLGVFLSNNYWLKPIIRFFSRRHNKKNRARKIAEQKKKSQQRM